MTASLLQVFMDALINLLIASSTLIILAITATSIIKFSPIFARWGYTKVLNFFGIHNQVKTDNHTQSKLQDSNNDINDEIEVDEYDDEKTEQTNTKVNN